VIFAAVIAVTARGRPNPHHIDSRRA